MKHFSGENVFGNALFTLVSKLSLDFGKVVQETSQAMTLLFFLCREDGGDIPDDISRERVSELNEQLMKLVDEKTDITGTNPWLTEEDKEAVNSAIAVARQKAGAYHEKGQIYLF